MSAATETPTLKIVLATACACCALALVALGIGGFAKSMKTRLASVPAVYAERQSSLFGMRRARDLQEYLGLSDSQTEELAVLLHELREHSPMGSRFHEVGRVSRTEKPRELRACLQALFTEEQRELLADGPRCFGGPWWPRPVAGKGWQ